LIVFYM